MDKLNNSLHSNRRRMDARNDLRRFTSLNRNARYAFIYCVIRCAFIFMASLYGSTAVYDKPALQTYSRLKMRGCSF